MSNKKRGTQSIDDGNTKEIKTRDTDGRSKNGQSHCALLQLPRRILIQAICSFLDASDVVTLTRLCRALCEMHDQLLCRAPYVQNWHAGLLRRLISLPEWQPQTLSFTNWFDLAHGWLFDEGVFTKRTKLAELLLDWARRTKPLALLTLSLDDRIADNQKIRAHFLEWFALVAPAVCQLTLNCHVLSRVGLGQLLPLGAKFERLERLSFLHEWVAADTITSFIRGCCPALKWLQMPMCDAPRMKTCLLEHLHAYEITHLSCTDWPNLKSLELTQQSIIPPSFKAPRLTSLSLGPCSRANLQVMFDQRLWDLFPELTHFEIWMKGDAASRQLVKLLAQFTKLEYVRIENEHHPRESEEDELDEADHDYWNSDFFFDLVFESPNLCRTLRLLELPHEMIHWVTKFEHYKGSLRSGLVVRQGESKSNGSDGNDE